MFECILLQSVTNRMSVIDLAPFLRKSSTYSPFTTTHCLKFIKTSLVHAFPGLVSELMRCRSEFPSI
jgi:hypothetical protein